MSTKPSGLVVPEHSRTSILSKLELNLFEFCQGISQLHSSFQSIEYQAGSDQKAYIYCNAGPMQHLSKLWSNVLIARDVSYPSPSRLTKKVALLRSQPSLPAQASLNSHLPTDSFLVPSLVLCMEKQVGIVLLPWLLKFRPHIVFLTVNLNNLDVCTCLYLLPIRDLHHVP